MADVGCGQELIAFLSGPEFSREVLLLSLLDDGSKSIC